MRGYMNNWLDAIARYVTQREALAEAILVEALRSPRISRKFQKVAGIDLRWNLKEVTSQEWSANREARHDIVLTSATGRRVRIELKGDAPFTGRQTRALRKGKRAGDLQDGRYANAKWSTIGTAGVQIMVSV